ncbi:hypothetical protein EDB83DRAFT_1981213 [Lactarius deliciosus]|nr:hypothetical protein EDB83DRAFT_1981213 [Lactarius deliciosus]
MIIIHICFRPGSSQTASRINGRSSLFIALTRSQSNESNESEPRSHNHTRSGGQLWRQSHMRSHFSPLDLSRLSCPAPRATLRPRPSFHLPARPAHALTHALCQPANPNPPRRSRNSSDGCEPLGGFVGLYRGLAQWALAWMESFVRPIHESCVRVEASTKGGVLLFTASEIETAMTAMGIDTGHPAPAGSLSGIGGGIAPSGACDCGREAIRRLAPFQSPLLHTDIPHTLSYLIIPTTAISPSTSTPSS